MRDFCSPYFSEIVECTDGTEAVYHYPSLHPDWTVMDIRMKNMDGIEAAKSIISNEANAKIILVSQFSDEGTIHEAVASGAVAFVKKDNLENVIEVIRKTRKKN